MKTPHFILFPLLITVFGIATQGVASADPTARWEIDERIDVEPVWSGHRVGMALLTAGDRQYVAYYDAERRMSIASRLLTEKKWQIQKLPTVLGWDSHNYVTMAVDPVGNLHVSGNMHCVPLIYFRTDRPGDVTSLKQHRYMVGNREDRCTYPVFLNDPKGRLLFVHRDGSSGNGVRLWNVFDTDASHWNRLLEKPLMDGRGLMNAYFVGPQIGPDGLYHMTWVWRDTPDCATNHDLSYARSTDLIHWTRSNGEPLELPITLETSEIIDPVPAGGGIINGNTEIGFDADRRIIISYHKYDKNGNTQIYCARLEADGWKIYQVTDWDYRWEFQGGGAINFDVAVSPVELDANNNLTIRIGNRKNGYGTWQLDPDSLKAVKKVASNAPSYPREITSLRSDFPGMHVIVRSDLGDRESKNSQITDNNSKVATRYILRMESRGSNRDRPFPGEIPPPSLLQIYRLKLSE